VRNQTSHCQTTSAAAIASIGSHAPRASDKTAIGQARTTKNSPATSGLSGCRRRGGTGGTSATGSGAVISTGALHQEAP
jgi:hypothetical protein